MVIQWSKHRIYIWHIHRDWISCHYVILICFLIDAKGLWSVKVFKGWVDHAFNVFRQHILPWTTDTQPIESNADLGQGLLGFANHSVWKITSSSSTSAWSGIRSGGWEQLYLTTSGSSLVKKKMWSLVWFCWSKPNCKCFFWCLLESLFSANQTQKIFKPTINAF